MKVGDVVYSTKIRPNVTATVIKADVVVKDKIDDKKQVRTSYIARYDDGSELRFYGCQINHSVFKVEDNGQMSIFDFIGKEE